MMDLDCNYKENTKQLGMTIKRRADDERHKTEDNWRISGGRGADDGAKNRSLCHPGVLPLCSEYNGPALHTLRALQIGIFTTTGDHPDTDQLENHIYFLVA